MSEARYYQKDAVDAMINWFKYEDTPAIIVLPTGSGKSHVIAALAEHYYTLGKRVAIIAHRKELLVQNGGKLAIPHGYCSASVGDKDLHENVIVGGIQSIINKDFEPFDYILIDECHRVPNNEDMGQYWRFISKHPKARIGGLTATPYRLEGGKLGWGEVVYQAPYVKLKDENYLSPISNKPKEMPDLSGIKVTAGDYNEAQLSACMEDPALIEAAVRHIIGYGDSRNSIIIFCVTVAHAELLYSAMMKNNLSVAILHGGLSDSARDAMLGAFKCGLVKHMINVMILLEGFDHPPIDMIVCLRPTKSKCLWEQMLGRGVRKHESKKDCLLIDMAGNLREHGGLGAPYTGKPRMERDKNNYKLCPQCEEYVEPADAVMCPSCKYQFPRIEEPVKAKHEYDADVDSEVVHNPIRTYDIMSWNVVKHIAKTSKQVMMKVTFHTSMYDSINVYFQPHGTHPRALAAVRDLYKYNGYEILPSFRAYSIDDIIDAFRYLKKPSKVVFDYTREPMFPDVSLYIHDETLDDEIRHETNRAGDTKSTDTLDNQGGSWSDGNDYF